MKAFWKELETELLMTWLMPHQQIRPEMAKERRDHRVTAGLAAQLPLSILMDIVGRTAPVAAVLGILLLIELGQGGLDKGGGGPQQRGDPHPEYRSGSVNGRWAATTPTRFPIPTRVAMETTRAWSPELEPRWLWGRFQPSHGASPERAAAAWPGFGW